MPIPPEQTMPLEQALHAIDAHEERLQRLEDDSRDAAGEVARHSANLGHLNEVMELKMKQLTDQVLSSNASVAGKLDGFSNHLTQVTGQLASNSTRIEKLEVLKHEQDKRWKWIKATVSTVVGGALVYGAQQLVAHFIK